jgi:hypothetical protein
MQATYMIKVSAPKEVIKQTFVEVGISSSNLQTADQSMKFPVANLSLSSQ